MARDDEVLNDDDDLEELELEEDDDELPLIGFGGAITFVMGLVLGTFIGAGVALLAAPERGSVTRRRLKRRLNDVQEGARSQVEDWQEGARRELARKRRRVRRRLKR